MSIWAWRRGITNKKILTAEKPNSNFDQGQVASFDFRINPMFHVTFLPFLLSIALNTQGELYSIKSSEHSSNVRCSHWRVNYAFVEKEEQTKKKKHDSKVGK